MAARSHFLAFMQFCWWGGETFKVGRHTIETCERLTKAVEDFKAGKSTFLLVNMPFRHGKSDMISRAFPAWFLGVVSEQSPDVIVTGHGASLASDFSDVTKNIIDSAEYRLVFPNVQIDSNRAARNRWGIQGSTGTVNYTGLASTMGKGYHLGILDDYCRDAKEAFSPTFRDSTWNSFASGLMTRRAPVAITIVVATMWHPDDVSGRILDTMKKEPNFPRFEHIVFPAQKKGPNGWDYLFPERFSPEWYNGHRATLGSYRAAALMDCNPVGVGTKMFKIALNRITKLPDRRILNVYILIDSANAKKKASDYTTMWVIGLGADLNYYVLDCVRDKLDLTQRTDALFSLVVKWNPMYVLWEQVGCMSDVQHVKYVQEQRGYHFVIVEIGQSVAKPDRIAWLIPVVESNRLWFADRIMYRNTEGVMRDLVLDFETEEYGVYPASTHDDMLDDLANIKHPRFIAIAHFPISRHAANSGDTGSTQDWKPW